MPNYARLIRFINLYIPFLCMGIRVRSVDADRRRFEVELREHWYNRNLFGTHFGGSLYTMSDPFYLFIVLLNLGDAYIVWDKSASIEFRRPARGRITGIFEIAAETLDAIRKAVDANGKGTYDFTTDLLDDAGEAVARVQKTIYVRRKDATR